MNVQSEGQHSITIPGWDGSLQELARGIVNLRYDALAMLLHDISLALKTDSEADQARRRFTLARSLSDISLEIYKASEHTSQIFHQVKPKLKRELEITPEVQI